MQIDVFICTYYREKKFPILHYNILLLFHVIADVLYNAVDVNAVVKANHFESANVRITWNPVRHPTLLSSESFVEVSILKTSTVLLFSKNENKNCRIF